MTTTTPFTGTQSGTWVSTNGGSQTFTRTVSDQGGVRTTDTTFTLPDGKTETRDATFTQTATGWTRDVTTTLANGTTTTLQETGTVQANGTTDISGTFKQGNRWTEDLSGTQSFQAGTQTVDLTFSNPWGSTRTLDTQRTVSNGTIDIAASGTSYSGANFSNTGALTVLQSQSA